MSCNAIIHNYLKNESHYIICPFCDVYELQEAGKSIYYNKCCNKMNLINDDSVCKYCGIVQFDLNITSNEFINFYENRHKIRIKTIYQRKYYIKKKLDDIYFDYKIYTNSEQTKKIYHVFDIIEQFNLKYYSCQKRSISINFILKKIFRILNINNYKLKVTKNKTTLKKYNNYWNKLKRELSF